MADATFHRICVWRAGAAAAAMVTLLLSGCAAPNRTVYLANANSGNWSLEGTLITPRGVIPRGVITIADDKIAAIKAISGNELLPSTTKIDGIILPGLIDLHNHLAYNFIQRWHPPKHYSNREEWRLSPEVRESVSRPYDRVVDELGCEANLYGEVKALVGGATSAVGTFGDDCITGLVRNLDHDSEFSPTFLPPNPCARYAPDGDPIDDLAVNIVFPLGGKKPDEDWSWLGRDEKPEDIPKLSKARAGYLNCNLHTGRLRSVLVHLAEGKPSDKPSQKEFAQLQDLGLLREGLIIIHGTALHQNDFAEMKASAAGLVWSPRSNMELYGTTSDIQAAKDAGVKIAIAPDWSVTGSDGMLQELNYTRANFRHFDAQQLTRMATSIPAKLARIENRIGQLKPGLYADLLVIRRGEGSAYDSVVTASPADVQLVVVGGRPVYGDSALMHQLAPGKDLELITVCGVSKAIDLGDTIAAELSWNDVITGLQNQLRPATLGTIGCLADLLRRPTPGLDSIPEMIPAPGPGPVEEDTDSLQPG